MKDCIVGPIETYNVKVDGRLIPRLTASPVDETRVELILDGRWSITLNKWDFRPVASMVANARTGESPSMVVRRTIQRPFVADWVVSVRRNGPDGFEVYCTGYGRSDYSPAAAMPKNLNLDWWLGGKSCYLIPGDYFIVTNWQINLPAGFDKTVSAASNVFEVRP